MVAFLVGLAMAAKVIVIHTNFRAVFSLVFMAGIILASIAGWFGIVPIIIAGNILFVVALVMAFIGLFAQSTKA